MCKFNFILVICTLGINDVTATTDVWVTRARVVNPIPYFSEVMQQFVNELEKREWCNLKLIDINRNVNTFIANWNVTGTVTYTNGFVVSIQAIDLHQVRGTVHRRNIDNKFYPTATVSGLMSFHDVNIGYDVIANLSGIGEQRYTGEILSNNIAFTFSIIKDLISKEITVTSSLNLIRGPQIQMVYRPANHVTEVLSRDFQSSDNWNGVRTWVPNFISIITDIAKNKVDFPNICFNNC
ncbi:unnamed protein product [Arctia plantaginis]|uniref:Uncharacterized protein n=1 Tax=Arctia plantaginis TaxID=874455 RepID=A0A8S1AVW3_ARCPL|nr:unnamed protein product [Arctia plantaginis]CAB3249423.1 unnamed protein product [Arctia plantaginis]